MKKYYLITVIIFLIIENLSFNVAYTDNYSNGISKSKVLDLNDCIRIALSYNGLYRASREKINAEKERMTGAYRKLAYPNITLDLKGQWQKEKFDYNQEPYNNYDRMRKSEFYPYGMQASVNLEKILYDGGINYNEIIIQKNKLMISVLNDRITKNEVIREVVKIYYQIMYLKEIYNLTNEILRLNKKTHETAKTRYDKGMLNELDYLKIQVSLQEAILNNEKANDNLKKANLYMLKLIGYKMNIMDRNLRNEIQIYGRLYYKDLTIPKHKELKSKYQTHILMQRFTLYQNILNTKIDIQNANNIPIIGIFGDFSYYYDIDSNDDMQDRNLYGWYVRTGIYIRFPISEWLLPYDHANQELEALSYEVRNLSYKKQNLKDDIRYEVHKNYDEIENIKKRYKKRKKLEIITKKTYRIAQKSFNSGSIKLIELKEIELKYIKSKIETTNEIYNYYNAYIDLLYSLGGDLEVNFKTN